MDKRLTIAVIGGLALEVDGKPVRTQSRKAEVLLACLALSGSGRMSRQKAAELLWSDSSEDAGRTSLREAVMTIKRALAAAGFSGFSAGRDLLELDLSQAQTDAHGVLDAIRGGKTPDLGQLFRFRYADSLLGGLDGLDEEFAAWLRMQRQIWRDMLSDALQDGYRKAAGNLAARQQWAKSLLAFDPCNEPVARHLMQMKADAGDYPGAMSVYAAVCDALREDIDSEPAPETRRLAEVVRLRQSSIKSATTQDYSFASARSAGPSPVIVVAPIPDIIADPRLASMLTGLRLELVSLLVRFREWSVVDWTAPSVGHARPTYTILFSGQFRDGQYAYTIALRDERDRAFIWSDTFRGGPDTLLESEETFVRRMASALNIHIAADRLRQFSASNAVPSSHFDAWVKAQQLMHHWREPEDMAAYDLLSGIVRDLPTFSPAYSALAQHANGRHIVNPGTFRDAELTLTAYRHASTARLLDPLDAKAHLSLSWSHALLGQFNEAETSFRDALQLNGNDPWVLTSATHGLAFCGSSDIDPLVGRIKGLGVALAPQHLSYLAGIHYLAGDYDAAILAARQVEHGYHGLRAWSVAANVENGDMQEARTEADRLFGALVRNWRSNRAATRAVAGDWLAELFPIRDQAVRKRLRRRLAEAGLA